MTKKQLSEAYEKNFQIMFRESQLCSCSERSNKFGKCSNQKHQEAIRIERKLCSLENRLKYDGQL